MPRSRTPASPARDWPGARQLHTGQRCRSRRQPDLLRTLRQCLPTALEFDAVLQETVRAAGTLMCAQAASLWRLDAAAGRLQVGAFWSTTSDHETPPQTIDLEQGAIGWVARHRQLLNVPDLFNETPRQYGGTCGGLVTPAILAGESAVRSTRQDGGDSCRAQHPGAAPQHPDYWQQHGWCSFLGLPILIEDNLFAVLACHDAEPFVLDDMLQEVLQTFLAGVCTTLQHAILYATEAMARRAAEQSAYEQANLAVRQASLYATETVARTALEAATRAKNAFLANMSHELRTPLNAVINYSELLQEEATEQGHLTYIADLQKIHAAGQRLLILVTDVLDFARIEAGKVELSCETFHVPCLVGEIVETLQPLLAQHANTFEVHIADDVQFLHADKLKVQQSLLQLLNNACKFTSHGHIALDVMRATVQDSAWIRFQVRDTGIGMSPEQLAKLFQPFTQGDDTTTRKYGGTGLGLVISKRLCQLMGGEITVTSTLGQGSTFILHLPTPVDTSLAAR